MTDRQQQFELTTQAYTFTRTGLAITGESTQADWELMGQGLQAVDEARQWAIGDWLRDGKRHYGDGLYKRAAEITGLKVGTLRDYKQLAETFSLSFRKDKLSHAHHAHAAYIKKTITDDKGKLALSDDPDFDKISELLSEAVKHGWSARELRDHVDRHKEQQREYIRLANEPEKYTVIYADPPWEYGDPRDDVSAGGASAQYDLMSIKQLEKLPVKQMAAENAVLFLWVTLPLMDEALLLVRSWGFKYKTQLAWDKGRPFYGNYSHVQHEALCICTRGTCTPVTGAKLPKSIIAINRGKHSAKPHEFYDIIDELYPNGNRIEMFARNRRDGWDSWGDQSDGAS